MHRRHCSNVMAQELRTVQQEITERSQVTFIDGRPHIALFLQIHRFLWRPQSHHPLLPFSPQHPPTPTSCYCHILALSTLAYQSRRYGTKSGCTKFNKVEFLAAVQSIRMQSFGANDIKTARRKAGILPGNPKIVTSLLPNPPPCRNSPRERISTPTQPLPLHICRAQYAQSNAWPTSFETENIPPLPSYYNVSPRQVRTKRNWVHKLVPTWPSSDRLLLTGLNNKFAGGSWLPVGYCLQSMQEILARESKV